MLARRFHLEVLVSVVSFASDAELVVPASPPGNVGRVSLETAGCTNEAAGLLMAREVWGDVGGECQLNMVLMGDGQPNESSDGLEPAAAAERQADTLKQRGARIATVAFRADKEAREHLKRVASSPSMFCKAGQGRLLSAFQQSTRNLTLASTRAVSSILYAFVMDCSQSMEGDKLKEATEALNATIQLLSAGC